MNGGLKEPGSGVEASIMMGRVNSFSKPGLPSEQQVETRLSIHSGKRVHLPPEFLG